MHKRYPRTKEDFVVDSIAELKKVIEKCTDAGFDDVPEPIIFRRFYQLLKFLQDNNLTERILYHDILEVNLQSDLKNSDLNDKGFYFLQYALGKWENRFHKDQGEEKEWKFLEKWYKIFIEKNSDLK
jgi:hypothetical protein